MVEPPRWGLGRKRVSGRGWLVLVVCLCPGLVFGCGYQQSGSTANAPAGYQWGTLYRGDVRTVAVPIFTNKTFYRGLEFNLTKAVAGQLEAQSPYRLAP